MKSSFRWYGDSDPVTLDKIRQIPGMRSIVSAVYDVKPGEVWPEESIKHLKAQRCFAAVYRRKKENWKKAASCVQPY